MEETLWISEAGALDKLAYPGERDMVSKASKLIV